MIRRRGPSANHVRLARDVVGRNDRQGPRVLLASTDMNGAMDPWQRLVNGDDAAWEDAVLLLFGRVRAFFVNKVGDRADDLTQRTFKRLLEIRAGYAGGSPRSYVFGIARYILFEFLREQRRDETVPLDEVSAAAMDPRPSSLLGAKAEQRLLLEALRHLPLTSQIVLELYYWEELNDREIAEIIESNANTVRGRRGHARKQLRGIIERLEATTPLASTSMDLDGWARSIKEQVLAGPVST